VNRIAHVTAALRVVTWAARYLTTVFFVLRNDLFVEPFPPETGEQAPNLVDMLDQKLPPPGALNRGAQPDDE